MGAGRKPIPRAFRVIQGTADPVPGEDEVIAPTVGIPDPPDYLEPDQQNVFFETARRLHSMGVMAEEYTDSIAMYAVSWCQWREATDKIKETGLLFRTKTGYPQQNPFVGIANNAQKDCLKILAEFGLTPSSSTRLKKG